jgi:hypothetical protein
MNHDTINSVMPEVFSRSKNDSKHPVHKHKKVFIPASIKHEHHSTNPLGSFLVRPKRAVIAVLEEDEEVILLLRRHPITLLPRIFAVLLILGIGFFFNSLIDLSFLPAAYSLGFGMLWFLFVFGMLFEKLVSWYFNMIIITDERVIDIDFLHLIYKNVTVTKIDNIEDVTYSVTGVLQSLLHYGNVLIQTAGAVVAMAPQQTVASIEIWSTPHPSKVVGVINDLMLQEEQEKLEGRAK